MAAAGLLGPELVGTTAAMSSTCTSDVDFGKITKTSNNASEAPTATATAKNETDNDADMEGHSCSGRRESLLKYARCVVLGAKWSTFAILVAVLFAQVWHLQTQSFMSFKLKDLTDVWYRVGRPIGHEVLKVRIWGIPPAAGPLL